MSIFANRINLDPTAKEQLIRTMNLGLGTALDLRSQIKQAHWNIKGAQFVARHELFDDLADHTAKWADDLAERAVTLGGYATGTMRLAADISRIPEYDLSAVDGNAHVKTLADRYGRFCALLREMVGEVERVKDPGTEDLLTGMLKEAEKDLWFLEAHVQA